MFTFRFARLTFGLWLFALPAAALAEPDPKIYWNIDDLKPGMKGYGLTVMKGTKIERFEAELLGVMKNTSPGRDMVLARLSGLDLERVGVIAGMSGSPVYIDNKLVGAVAYAWAYGKDPIAGITPFSQMNGFVASFERRDLADKSKPSKVGLKQPIQIDGKWIDSVTVSNRFDDIPPGDGFAMAPLQTPLSAGGFTAHSLKLLKETFPNLGLMPVQTGTATGKSIEAGKNVKIEPGGALAIGLITGDFDMSAIGTVTHVESDRVYGWGHPFMSLGGCDLPLMTGEVVTVYPRVSVSFKMGTPLCAVGTINADVSTCIAGWLGKKPDMLPMSMIVRREDGGEPDRFNVEMVRQKQLLPGLVFAALTNSVDMQGDLPEEITISFQCRMEIEGKAPVIIRDTFAGSSYGGSRAASALYSPVSMFVSQMVNNPFEPIRITKIECETVIQSARRAAEIEGIELASDTVAPGGLLKASVFLKPYRGPVQKMRVSLKIPADLPDGTYSAVIGDDVTNMRAELRGHPEMGNPLNIDAMLAGLRLIASAKRTTLAVRLPLPSAGVAIDGKPLPDLPPSAVQMFGQTRRTPVAALGAAIVARYPTEWVIAGGETVRFTVSRSKRSSATE
jgi:hypothetical protein